MIKGILFILLTSGTEVAIPADHLFPSVEVCEEQGNKYGPIFVEGMEGVSFRFTCEPVEEAI